MASLTDIQQAFNTNVSTSDFMSGVGGFSNLLAVAVGIGIFFAVLKRVMRWAVSPAERL